ncbi:pimeloyl-ACP methyl ester carboxylesterase [Kitasatospora herbaricolor]|uniref:lipase family protein n=1 Tax=Kitasatospora herbaricolor TaxID=68217 RepID=UPI00174CFA73|nr:lipase family protein [Kitasatospora herbaricolor]MDQ0311006.1 pimeloyl-ACP methyl ester carboxylesterase [Kitasatospora herbaricolor]
MTFLALPGLGTGTAAATGGGVGGERSAQCAPGVPAGPDGDAFYEPPSPLPRGRHGDLIRAHRIEAPDGARACKILYLSTLHDGTRVAVSGLVAWPDGPAPRGGRNVVAWAHGTVGGPRQCAPSAAPNPARDLVDYFTYDSPFQIDVGVPALTQFLAAGDVVVATDYQGLGTPGVHQYVVGATETHNVLDSVTAAQQLRPVHAGKKVAVLGWSQGGGAGLFVGQDTPAYSPGLDLVGVAALAPAADLGPQFAGLVPPGPRNDSSESHNAALRINVYRGFLAAYPELRATDVLQPAGIQALEGDGVACIEHFADVIQNNVGDAHQLDTLFKPLREVPDSWHQRFHENTPGYVTTVAPVLVMQGTADTVINPHSTEQYIRRACGFSQPVEYTTYEGATHNTIPFEAQQEYLSWIADRFAGSQAPSNC